MMETVLTHEFQAEKMILAMTGGGQNDGDSFNHGGSSHHKIGWQESSTGMVCWILQGRNMTPL